MVPNVNDILVLAVLHPSHAHHPGHTGFQVLDIIGDVSLNLPATLVVELIIDLFINADDCALQVYRLFDQERKRVVSLLHLLGVLLSALLKLLLTF